MSREDIFIAAVLATGVVTYLLRIAPIFIGRKVLVEGSLVVRLLEYATYAILGGLISLTVWNANVGNHVGNIGLPSGVMAAFIALAGVIVVTMYIKSSVTPSLIVGLGLYVSLYFLGF
jgi:branched-subunit amino acid transport protein